MQTFLPYPSFADSMRVLDRQRLGKQRVETYQIMGALLNNKGWTQHPATKMWKGYEWALLQYQKATVDEWLSRGYVDTCYEKTLDLYYSEASIHGDIHAMPSWLGDESVHRSHQSNLMRKDPEFYGRYFGHVPDDLPYTWPPSKDKGLIMPKIDNLVFEDATIMFRNFAGREATFNSAGDRNFCLFLDPKKAASMKEEGWNTKALRPREEDDVPQDYIQVAVSYGKGRPPRIVIITSKNRVELGGDEVAMLDFADIKGIDVVLNPYEWEVNGNKGVKAYLKTAFITLNEDELELKYAEAEAAQTPTMSSTVSED